MRQTTKALLETAPPPPARLPLIRAKWPDGDHSSNGDSTRHQQLRVILQYQRCISRCLPLEASVRVSSTCARAAKEFRWHGQNFSLPGSWILRPGTNYLELSRILTSHVVGAGVRSCHFDDATLCGFVKDPWLLTLAAHCPNLTSLDLSGCSQVTGQGLRAAFSQASLLFCQKAQPGCTLFCCDMPVHVGG